jgi:hypothetical protein
MRIIIKTRDDEARSGECHQYALKAIEHWKNFEGDWSQGAIAAYAIDAQTEILTSTERTKTGFSCLVYSQERSR